MTYFANNKWRTKDANEEGLENRNQIDHPSIVPLELVTEDRQNYPVAVRETFLLPSHHPGAIHFIKYQSIFDQEPMKGKRSPE